MKNVPFLYDKLNIGGEEEERKKTSPLEILFLFIFKIIKQLQLQFGWKLP